LAAFSSYILALAKILYKKWALAKILYKKRAHKTLMKLKLDGVSLASHFIISVIPRGLLQILHFKPSFSNWKDDRES